MKYCLVYYNTENIIEIKNYMNQENLRDETSLKEITNFTSQFTDEDELFFYLINCGSLPNDLNTATFGIGIKKNKTNEIKILPYGVSYARDQKFFDFKRLSNFFITHISDEDFMNNFFDRYYKNLINVSFFQTSLTIIKNGYNKFCETGLIPANVYPAMSDFLLKYTIKKNANNRKTRDFTRLRDLAMFVINYIREKNLRDKPIISCDEDIDEINILITHYENLLKDEGLEPEVREIYESAIVNLKHTLDTILYIKKRRRIKNGTSKN